LNKTKSSVKEKNVPVEVKKSSSKPEAKLKEFLEDDDDRDDDTESNKN
jgi:hypothetical protein